MRKEKARYDAMQALTVKENVGVEMGVGVEEEEDAGESESDEKEDEDEDEPMHSSRLSVKVKGKRPVK